MRELECLQGNYSGFADGKEYLSRDHPNSFDLDLFGHSSIFQYINRTTSKPAADKLSAWLNSPAGIDEILARQRAAEDLSQRLEWRQQLMTFGYSNPNSTKDPKELLDWVNSKDLFQKAGNTKLYVNILNAITIVAIAAVIFGLPAGLLAPVLLINFIYYFLNGKRITTLHDRVGKSSVMLKTYSSTIRLIEQEKFNSDALTKLKGRFSTDNSASQKIARLSKITDRLDARLNILVAIPQNLFFFWDIRCCLALEKWKNDNSQIVSDWFDAMAEFEVLSSFANMAFNNPAWVMPVIHDEYFILKAAGAGHPLIPADRRISNSIEIQGKGKAILVTGSNMSGKSTFLRTCGINAVLALAGAPVCAEKFEISHVHVCTSMRISDSLEDNTSSFYAELKRLAEIIREAEKNPKIFLLLDEILRGTNSNDRYIGSVALIKQLIRYGAVSIVATHDLRLAELEQELAADINNYHFDVKINGEELYFDYMLTPGVCTSLNASLLMKKMGIRI
jgi:DNA mismatch repair ATPase MutS